MEGDDLGLFEHFGALSVYVYFLFSCILFQHILAIYNDFVDNIDLIIDTKNECNKREKFFNEIEDRIQNFFEGKKINIIVLLIFLLGAALNAIITSMPSDFYNNDFFDSFEHIGGYVIWRIVWIIFIGLILSQLTAEILKMILSIKMIFKIIQDKGVIKLIPIFPDGAGGLGYLGKFSLNLDFGLAPLSIIVPIFFITQGMTLTNYILFFVVILSMIFIFFAPLWPAHKIMRDTKRSKLEDLGKKYKECYYKLLDVHESEKEKTISYKTDLEKIKKIEFFYTRTEKMPIWPFDTSTIIRFAGTVLFPILLVIIQILFTI